MTSQLQSRILKALFAALRPLAKTLLRAGIGYREFSEAAKAAFITEATEGFGVRGRATNISRVAVMTGLSRKEVKRIRDEGLDDYLKYTVAISPGALVLQFWHTDPKYSDESGRPNVLDFDGPDCSFSSLVKGCAGDIPPGAIRAELIRIGAVKELPGKKLIALKRDFVPSGLDERLILGLDAIIQSTAQTLSHNCDPKNVDDLFFQQLWGVNTISPKYFNEIKNEARERLTEVGKGFDDYLATFEALSQAETSVGAEVGIGLYYYEMPTNE